MRYEAPETLDAAVALLAGEPGETRLLTGGTDLLVQLKTDLVEPELVVDIKSIREVRTIKREAGGFRIGAAVTAAELSEHAELKQAWPGVVGAGVNLTVDQRRWVQAARVALGAVAERPLLVPEAGQALVGAALDEAALERFEHAVRAACRPIDDKRGTKEFRIKVAGGAC